jgi:hypothetical protein
MLMKYSKYSDNKKYIEVIVKTLSSGEKLENFVASGGN